MMKMRFIRPLPLALLAILPACVAPPPPPVEEVVTVKPTHYWVVPMESPSLGFAGRSADAGLTVPVVLTQEGGWNPGAWFAAETERQLQLAGIAASHGSRSMPVDGGLEGPPPEPSAEWLESVRQWYESPVQTVDYLQVAPGRATRILEVGVANYSIEDHILYLSLLTRLIDYETGQVLRRSRVFSTTDVYPDRAFTNEARQFKATFAKTGEQLVRKSLSQIGLVE